VTTADYLKVYDDITPREQKDLEKLTESYSQLKQELTEEQLVFMEAKFSSKMWRMNNLYTILDKDGVKGIMRLNKSQYRTLSEYKHGKKLILKSRQQGISTLFLAYYLDACLTKPGYQAGIQSYGQDEAEKLSKRALLMWDDLDTDIKSLLQITLVASNSKGMTFSNGSILKIGNFRGDTLQGLHVSELGKIAKKYPEKAKELKTGAFQAVGKNSKISVESTSEGASGMFFDMCMKAIGHKGELGPFDFQFIFLSWIIDPDCTINTIKPATAEQDIYFAELEKSLDIILTPQQRWWYVSKEDELGEYMKQEYPATPEEAFRQSVEGTYYKREYEALEIAEGLYNPHTPVHRVMDIGVNDENTVLYFQQNGDYVDIVYEYSNSGVGIEYYHNIDKELQKVYGFQYTTTFFPHDIKVLEWGNGKTRLKVVRSLGYRPQIVKKYKLLEGIETTRQFLKGKVRVDKTCERLITAIQMYRKKYDKRLEVFLAIPEHDDHSHWADALRYLACGLKQYSLDTTIAPLNDNSYQQDGFAI